jgi:hypothetical protein
VFYYLHFTFLALFDPRRLDVFLATSPYVVSLWTNKSFGLGAYAVSGHVMLGGRVAYFCEVG